MIRLYLVRHGETEFNLQGRIQGHKDSPLTELGIRQANAVAKRLSAESFTAVYCSDLNRARRTAEIIVAHHPLELQVTPLLRERAFGVLEGLTRADIEEFYLADENEWRRDTSIPPPGQSETHAQVVERCAEFLDMLIREYESDARILVVGHGGTMHGMMVAACRLPIEFYRMQHYSNASISIIDIGDNPRVRCLNDTCHLHDVEVTDVDADNA